MRLFQRSKSTREFSDYRAVADAVRARCSQRETAPDEWVAHDELRDAARSYAPEERLQVVSDEVQQFQRDCENMPRTWEKDPENPPQFEPDPALSQQILYATLILAFGFAVFCATVYLASG